jgi:hypothetical protein
MFREPKKWGPTKTFCANLWKNYFLLVCPSCYVNDVYLSCLLNSIVNQHNPCALVIMPLFMLLATFQNHHLGNLSFLISSYLTKTRAKIHPWDKAFIKTSIYKNFGIHKVEWSHYFTNLYLLLFIKRFSNTFRKTFFKGNAMSPLVLKNLQKLYSFIWNSFLFDHGMITIEHLFNHYFW